MLIEKDAIIKALELVKEDDFYKEASETKRTESFTLKMTFAGLSENQRTKFFEIVDFDLTNLEDSVARLEYTASWPLKNGSKVSVKRVFNILL